MKSMFDQQRKRLRVAWRTKTTIRIMRDQRTVEAVTRNVSVHGVLVFAAEPLEPGTPVQVILDLRLPGSSSPAKDWPLEMRGTVARKVAQEGNVVAITFDSPSPDEYQKLRTAVFAQAMRLMERISEFPAFWDLTELDQLALTTVCHEVQLGAGEQLVRLGDEATSLFLVKSGRVQLRSPFADDVEDSEVELAHAGQIFGEVSALLDLPHNLDIVAQTETELLAIPRESLHFLRDHNPNLALTLYEIFAAFMGRRLRKLTTRVFSPLNADS